MRVFICADTDHMTYYGIRRLLCETERLLEQHGYEPISPNSKLDYPDHDERIKADLELLKTCEGVFSVYKNKERAGESRIMRAAKRNGMEVFDRESLNMDRVLNLLARAMFDVMGVSVEKIRSRDKVDGVAYARRIYAIKCLEFGLTTTKTGELINRNHSTVVYYNKTRPRTRRQNAMLWDYQEEVSLWIREELKKGNE